uniref:DUF148 domain-containing protein n=1 Tax=Parastrongyloides trichosuri TaxID=131310 RepID=A0A0N4ZH25_PARTI
MYYKIFITSILSIFGIIHFHYSDAAIHVFVDKSNRTNHVRNHRSINNFDPLNAHGGIFRKLLLTKEEMQQISEYHAMTEYSKLIEFVEIKILNSDHIENKEKINLLKLIHRMKPPKSVKHLLSKTDKHKMKAHYHKQEIGEAMDIVLKRLDEKDTATRNEIVDYFGLGKEDPMRRNLTQNNE